MSPVLDAVLLERTGSAGESFGPEVLRIARIAAELERDEVVFLEVSGRAGRTIPPFPRMRLQAHRPN